ncbi:MAG: DUF3465 domain-containing protein [Marinicella sp.]
MSQKKQALSWKKGVLLVVGIFIISLIKGYYIDQPERQNKAQIKRLFNQKSQGEMVRLVGRVYKNLPDDNIGDRHQRMLINVGGYSVLIAHNIDLAPRVPVKEKDELVVYGEYVWNEKGGVIHWTHHDPQNRREGGWIEHNGKKFK